MSGHFQNVGPLDAAVRVIAGILIVFAAPFVAVTYAPDWSAVGVPMLFITGGSLIMTGSMRVDPLYALVEINTARRP